MNQKLHPHLEQLERSATLAINERSVELEKMGQTIYRFGLGQSPFPVPESIVRALQENAFRKDYLPVEGLLELRKAVANFHQEENELKIKPEGIMVGPGSKELMFTLQLALEGSTLIPSPCWVSYAPQANILKRQNYYINTHFSNKWRLQPGELISAIKSTISPYLLILNYPCNPEGSTYSSDELEAIANVARDNNVLILSDEIYGQLHHDGEHISIARFYPEGTIVSSGLSKWCGAGGWRLGHFAFPKNLYWLKDAMASIASETYSCVAAPIQHAAVVAYRDKETVEEHLYHSRRILKTVGQYCSNALASANVDVHSPSGAFYLFPDFSNHSEKLNARGINDSSALCAQLLKNTGVALLPGIEFGRPAKELNARIAYVNFDGGKTLLTSRKISMEQNLTMDDLGENAMLVKQGIENIIQWINN